MSLHPIIIDTIDLTVKLDFIIWVQNHITADDKKRKENHIADTQPLCHIL